MPRSFSILAICGSTKQRSANLHLIHAITAMSAGEADVRLYTELMMLPPFSPDLDTADAPVAVAALRAAIAAADAVLISTPEYAGGVPGVLKNAIDWTVSSMTFSRKPVALITGSTAGRMAHQSLLGTLLIIESRITASTQLLLPAIQTKVREGAGIIDTAAKEQVAALLAGLYAIIADVEGNQLDYLPAPPVH
ncbi:NAD(P)H-dependent oxidoreductase [Chitinophaga pendula]|uniref:NADPH-dependent FMN reductase n=1 Tax=Chitinophaga TaxID=79328 RepID=UPI000BAFE1E3|nr:MULTISPECIES: NAD(P)H-dependent oxidoreductase [Chitinophaga]ASZ12225.1 flavoprotein [Chitinophaga sp. MD30]UCJ04743.1 NAD(P)H-dependent oxidoreductase [Chitinophaga pendula]